MKVYDISQEVFGCKVYPNDPMPDTPDDFIGDGNEGMFAFQKVM